MKLSHALFAASTCLAAACGGDDPPATPDGAGPDADLTPDAVVAGEVTMTVQNAGVPVPGTPVLFYEADGTLVANEVSDAAGVASAALLPGGSVVVIPTTMPTALGGGGGSIVAYVGVQPGDDLRFGSAAPVAESVLTTQLTAPTFATADAYDFTLGCGGFLTSATPTVTFTNINCTASTAVAVTARLAGTPLATIYVPAQALTATVTVAGPYQAMVASSVTATNLSPAVTEVDVEAWRTAPEMLQIADDIQGSGAPVGGEFAVSGPLPAFAGGSTLVVTQQTRNGFPGRFQLGSYPSAAALTVDASANVPPWVAPAVFDAKTRTFTWSSVGEGAIDYTIGGITGEAVGGATGYLWYVHGLVPSMRYTLPDLPAAFAAYEPAPNDLVNQPFALFMNADAARLDLLRREFALFFAGEGALLPAAGGYVALSGDL